MINRVELIISHQFDQMRKLHGENSVRLEQNSNAFNKIIEIWNMGQYIITQHQFSLAVLTHNLKRRAFTKKLRNRIHSFCTRHLRHILGRLDSQHLNSSLCKILKEIPVITCDLYNPTF